MPKRCCAWLLEIASAEDEIFACVERPERWIRCKGEAREINHKTREAVRRGVVEPLRDSLWMLEVRMTVFAGWERLKSGYEEPVVVDQPEGATIP